MKQKPSGKFVVRLSSDMHASLKRRARLEGVSLNTLCLSAFTDFLGSEGQDRHGEKFPLQQARDLLGESLEGILLFGSAARGEMRDSSDVDVMIVVSAHLPLSRTLYERWDRGTEEGFGSRLSPHFVHLPEDPDVAGSLWYEAAVDGVVLFDRDGGVARFLRRVRRSMAEGRLRRKTAYGHPYWIKAAQEASRVQ